MSEMQFKTMLCCFFVGLPAAVVMRPMMGEWSFGFVVFFVLIGVADELNERMP